MMTATKDREDDIRLQSAEEDNKALIEKPRKYWSGSSFLQAVNACDKIFNCAYVKFQLEEELMEEKRQHSRTGSVEHLWRTMEKGVEVEVYRQFLFEENGLEPFEDPSSHPQQDNRDGTVERPEDEEPRTSEE